MTPLEPLPGNPELGALYRPLVADLALGMTVLGALLVRMRQGKLAYGRGLLLTVSGWIALDPRPAGVAENLATAGLLYTVLWMTGVRGMLVGLLALLLYLTTPTFVCGHGQGKLTCCKSNLKNLATALEMFSTDHVGVYPRELREVTPAYVRCIPACPISTVDGYSFSYRSATDPDAFTLFCVGDHTRSNTPSGYPRYSSYQGLIER